MIGWLGVFGTFIAGRTRLIKLERGGWRCKFENGKLNCSKNKAVRGISCDRALFDICLKHISCRQLWHIFRGACLVDSSNQCKMVDRESCWQSFEGISWTGLGNCSCNSRNSDCHWIRLQARYNKCIYEIQKSENSPSTIAFPSFDRELTANIGDEQRWPTHAQSSPTPSGEEGSGVIQVSTRFTPQELYAVEDDASNSRHQKTAPVSNTASAQPSSVQREHNFTPTVVSWIDRVNPFRRKPIAHLTQMPRTDPEAHHRKPIKNETIQMVEPSNEIPLKAIEVTLEPHGGGQLKSSSVPSSPIPRKNKSAERHQPVEIVKSSVKIAQKYSSTSTCVSAINRCDSIETCKWHLSEVQMRCTQPCSRQLCAQAIQRFTWYVPKSAVESLMFCHCKANDADCLFQQQQMFPHCLYTHSDNLKMTCTEAVEMCRHDRHCQHFSSALFNYCAVRNGACAIKSDFEHCRHALIAVRGTFLDHPCYCHKNDSVCIRYQSGMVPTNPCIGQSMLHYSNLLDKIPSTPLASDTDFREISEKSFNGQEKKLIDSADGETLSHAKLGGKTQSDWNPQNRVQFGGKDVWAKKQQTKWTVEEIGGDRQPTSHSIDTDIVDADQYIRAENDNFFEKPRELVRSLDQQQKFQMDAESGKITGRKPTDRKDGKAVGKIEGETHDGTAADKNASWKVADKLFGRTDVSAAPRLRGSMYTTSEEDVMRQGSKSKLLKGVHAEAGTSTNSQNKKKNATFVSVPSSSKAITLFPQSQDGGCLVKDVNGNTIIHSRQSVFKRFHDWAGRCSSWCTCSEDDKMSCSKLPCLAEGDCKAPLTKIEYGERLYVKDRGACTCMTGVFICEQPEKMPKLDSGLFLLVGYSVDEISIMKESMPKHVLERSGFVSNDDFVVHDIGSRLQVALERLTPPDVICRLTSFDEFKDEGNVIYQVEWFGVNSLINETTKRWHSGQPEKACSTYVNRLADAIMRGDAVRYELVLSTIKQIRVLDLLDKIPDATTLTAMPNIYCSFILLFSSIIYMIW